MLNYLPNEALGEAMLELLERTQRGIPLSDLFVKLLCGAKAPTPKLLEWFKERRLEMEQSGVEEFTFRVAGLVMVKAVPVGGARKVRQEEFVGTLFEIFPLP